MATTSVDHIDIYDPDGYVAAPPHEVLERLRREEPIFRQDMPDGTFYWAVLKHADVLSVARQPNLYSAWEGGVVLEDLDPDALAGMRNMLLAMDPPRHVDWRKNFASSFKVRVIASLEERIRNICRQIFARAADARDVEFVHEVTGSLPSQVVGELVGLPEEDWSRVQEWAERNTSGTDPDINPSAYEPATSDAASNPSIEMAMYAIGLAQRRRTEPPRDDLMTVMLEAEVDGTPMTDIELGSFFVQLVTAGNDTTKTMLSSGLLALLEHPDEMAALRADPSLVSGAVEEILRWANPLHYFRRTTTAPTELHGVPIGAGEKVAMYYTSANRDEDVFDDPHAFKIRRDPNPQLSFGFAEHFCLGAHLARLEGRVFFEELLATFGSIELTGEPKRVRSNLNNALKALPVRLTPA